MKIRLGRKKDFRSKWGWNVRENRPATRHEAFHTPRAVCQCPACCTDPHYSNYYCGRTKEEGYVLMLENRYMRGR